MPETPDFSLLHDMTGDIIHDYVPDIYELIKFEKFLSVMLRDNLFEFSRHVAFSNWIFGLSIFGNDFVCKAPDLCPCKICSEFLAETKTNLEEENRLATIREKQQCNTGIPQPQRARIFKPSPIPGFVYLIKSGIFYKIGKTRNLEKRSRWMAIHLPEPMVVVHSFPSNDHSRAEKELHDRFSELRSNGEWFKLSQLEVEEIITIKEMNFQGDHDAEAGS
jgi:hypothetical protein